MQNKSKHRLIGLAAIFALAIVGLSWQLSYVPDKWILRSSDGRLYFFAIAGGRTPNSWFMAIKDEPGPELWITLDISSPTYSQLKRVNLLGVRYLSSNDRRSSEAFTAVSISYFHVLLLALVSLWLWYRNRLRRHPAGAVPCPVCNYDLRATPAQCPECGTATVSDLRQEQHVSP